MKDLSLHILDLVENSVRAMAKRIAVTIIEEYDTDSLTLCIQDNGIGIAKEMIEQVSDPFFTTRSTRDIGLGVPLMKQNAEAANGTFQITSELGMGTEVKASMQISHYDCLPIGDIVSTIVNLMSAHPEVQFIFTHSIDKRQYVLDSFEVRDSLDGVPLTTPVIRKFLFDMIRGNLEHIQ